MMPPSILGASDINYFIKRVDGEKEWVKYMNYLVDLYIKDENKDKDVSDENRSRYNHPIYSKINAYYCQLKLKFRENKASANDIFMAKLLSEILLIMRKL